MWLPFPLLSFHCETVPPFSVTSSPRNHTSREDPKMMSGEPCATLPPVAARVCAPDAALAAALMEESVAQCRRPPRPAFLRHAQRRHLPPSAPRHAPACSPCALLPTARSEE